MTLLIGSPKAQFFDTSTGEPLVNGKVYSYLGGSVNTPKDTYPTMPDADAGTNPNTNPVILDARGEANIVIQGSTKLALYDSNDVLIYSVDYLDGIGDSRVTVNGDTVLELNTVPDYANYWSFNNSSTTNPITVNSVGTDSNIGMSLSTKGSGTLKLDGGSTGVLELNSVASGAINLRRATTAHTTLTVTGAATCSSTLAVTGITTCTGALNANGGFNLLGAGMIAYYGGATAPTGWLECNGAAVSRTTYATLYAIIGTTFGAGDGSTTFNVPQQARNVLVGKGGAGTATLANTIGSLGGTETHTLITAEMPAHTHTVGVANSASYAAGGSTAAVVTGAALSTTSTGSGTAHNNLQPSLVVMMIVKT